MKQDLLVDLLASAEARGECVDTYDDFAAFFLTSWDAGGAIRSVASVFPNGLRWRLPGLRLRYHMVGGVLFKSQNVPGSESFETLEHARDHMCRWL